MARIGKNVTFDGSRETIADVLVQGIAKLALTDINFSFIDNNTINIYGEQADLTTLKTHANNKGYTFTINGDAPAESIPPVETPPTVDEVQANLEMRTAFNTVMQNLIDAIWTDVEVEYNVIKTTAEPFQRITDIKHLRQKA